MKAPLTLAAATERGLIVNEKSGILTFSNGDAWDSWSAGNCHVCHWFDPDNAGALCAFEAAAFLSGVSPDLARLFGWERRPHFETGDPRHGWKAPAECAFLRRKDDDRDDDAPPAAPVDPNQLVMGVIDPLPELSHPTLTPIESLVEVCS